MFTNSSQILDDQDIAVEEIDNQFTSAIDSDDEDVEDDNDDEDEEDDDDYKAEDEEEGDY